MKKLVFCKSENDVLAPEIMVKQRPIAAPRHVGAPRSVGAKARATPKAKERRSSCPIAGALDLLGDRWSLLVIRDVMFLDHHTYGELLDSPEGIATNILTSRLRRLQAEGILERRLYRERPPRYAYHLTEKGETLRPVLLSLGKWALTHLPDTVLSDTVKQQLARADGKNAAP